MSESLRLVMRRSSSSLGPWMIKRRFGLAWADFAMPATMTAGPESPPIASIEITVSEFPTRKPVLRRACYLRANLGLRVDFVQIDFFSLSHNFAICIVTTGRADVMRALQLTAICALVGIVSNQCIMGPAIVPARTGNFILLDSHGLNFRSLGRQMPRFHYVSRTITRL